MNERKLIDEIKRLVNDDAISGYYNGTTFNGDNGLTYTNLITNNSSIGRGFIVPYNNQWLVVVSSNNVEVRKNIITNRRKITTNDEVLIPDSCELYATEAWQIYSFTTFANINTNILTGLNRGLTYLSPDRKAATQNYYFDNEAPGFGSITADVSQSQTITTTENTITFEYSVGINNLQLYESGGGGRNGVFVNSGTNILSFLSPTESTITININSNVSSFVLEPISSTLVIDGNQTYYGNTVSYTGSLTSGLHEIGYGVNFKVGNPIPPFLVNTNYTCTVSIIIETQVMTKYYIQRKNNIVEVGSLERYNNIFTGFNNIEQPPKYYLTNTKDSIYFHVKEQTKYLNLPSYVDFTLINRLYRYVINKKTNIIVSSTYTEPDVIPELPLDWQKDWTSSYLPEVDLTNACKNIYKTYYEQKLTNFTKKLIITVNINQLISGSTLLNQLLYGVNSSIIAKFTTANFNNDPTTCSLSLTKTISIKLYKCQINDVSSGFIKLIDISILI